MVNQEFIYHNHSYPYEEVLKKIKEVGISMIGFCENIPNPELVLPDEDNRMLLSDVEEYIASINKLKEENPDTLILAGFEAEFDPMKETFLGEMREKVDYMLLGQHFVNRGLQTISSKNNPNYPIEYANMVCKAIDSGIFDIVVHPDYFIGFRNTITDASARKLFDENIMIASQAICEKASDMGIPIEINFDLMKMNSELSDGSLKDKYVEFWKVANKTEGLQILCDISVTKLNRYNYFDNEEVLRIINLVKDKVITGKYNPVEARKSNIKLQDAYFKGQANALTFETHIINQIVLSSLAYAQENLDSDTLVNLIGASLNSVSQEIVNDAKRKKNQLAADVEEANKNVNKHKIISRKWKAFKEIDSILLKQQQVLELAKNNTINAIDIGCETKYEYANIITLLTQYYTSRTENQKNQIAQSISNFSQVKSNANENVYQLLKSQNNSFKSHKGFIDLATLILLFIVILVFGIIICCMIYMFTGGG